MPKDIAKLLGRSTSVRIRDLIVATKPDNIPVSRDAQLISDIDLSILGQPFEVFDNYERQIRYEYSWVPTAAYIDARSKILSSFLNRSRIYFIDRFENMYGSQAKVNLTRSLSKLRSSFD